MELSYRGASGAQNLSRVDEMAEGCCVNGTWLRRSVLRLGIAIVLWPVAARSAEEPTAPGPIKGLEGLGFSVAPQGGGKVRTGLFGVYGEGYKFVYAFDRSGSMGGSGRTSLRAVKAQLTASLKQLDSVHQFQIIFYNERPLLFNPTGTPGRLVFATEQNKSAALKFLDTVEAEGGTEHEEALRMACALRPDVIFFLTDGDEPRLTPQQLERIERWTAGIRLNVIEFGPGPKPEGQSFLVKLAHQSGGDYVYVDATKLPKGD